MQTYKPKKYVYEEPIITQPYPLTRMEDVDYEILKFLNADELIAFCSSHKQIAKQCQNKEFWRQKMILDQLLLPEGFYDLLDYPVNWVSVYKLIQFINSIPYTKNRAIIYFNTKYDPIDFIYSLLELYADTIKLNKNNHLYKSKQKRKYEMNIYKFGNYYSLSIITYDYIIESTIHLQNLINFLFNIMVNQSIFNVYMD